MKKMTCAIIALAIGFAATAEVVKTGNDITITGVGTVRVDVAEIQVDVRPGATATVESGKEPVTVHVSDATVNLSNGYSDSWKEDVVLWLDASKEESFDMYDNNGSFATNGVTVYCPRVQRWRDWRGSGHDYYAFSSRLLSTCDAMRGTDYEGRYYVSFGNYVAWGRRVEFYKTGEGSEQLSDRKTIPYKFAAIVFGSQLGGGQSIISSLKRAGSKLTPPTASDSIFGENFPTWVDGQSVNPKTHGLNGDWEVISFTGLNGGTLQAVGLGVEVWGESEKGGQNYREIILLTRVPSETERRSIERYLAEKWNTALPSYEGEIRLFGNGNATVGEGTFYFGGEFSGTMTLDEDATLKLTDTLCAPTNPASFGSTIHDAAWYDPNKQGSITSYSGAPEEYRAHSVGNLYNLREAFGSQTYVLYGSSRTPSWENTARGFGPQNTWLFYDSTRTLNAVGCTLRIGSNSTMDGPTFGFKTGFIVLDTSSGGGTPFLAVSLNGDSEHIYYRDSKDTAIFRSVASTLSFVTNAEVRLNGVLGEMPTVRKFNYRPELLSVTFDETFPLRCVGSYNNTSADNMLIHGESIFYARKLTETERADTEAYLMKKWLGITPQGYGDPSAITIAGAGSVVLSTHVKRPSFAAAFSGNIHLPQSITFAFATNASVASVSNPILAGSAQVFLPDSLAVSLDLNGMERLPIGEYVLVESAGISGECEISLDTTSLGRHARFYEIRREAGRLVLRKRGPGFMVKFL